MTPKDDHFPGPGTQSFSCAWFLHRMEPPDRDNPEYKNNKETKSLFWIHTKVFCWLMGNICNSEENSVHGVFFCGKLGTFGSSVPLDG